LTLNSFSSVDNLSSFFQSHYALRMFMFSGRQNTINKIYGKIKIPVKSCSSFKWKFYIYCCLYSSGFAVTILSLFFPDFSVMTCFSCFRLKILILSWFLIIYLYRPKFARLRCVLLSQWTCLSNLHKDICKIFSTEKKR
jgi:hypothetical protein